MRHFFLAKRKLICYIYNKFVFRRVSYPVGLVALLEDDPKMLGIARIEKRGVCPPPQT